MALQDKKVLVLGGSRGIGAAVVDDLAREGADVSFTYAASHDSANALAGRTGSKALVADSADIDAVVSVICAHRPIDILIVNAGVMEIGDPLDLPRDVIERSFLINIHCPYFAAVEAARSMPEGGRIIVMGSINGDRALSAGATNYSMAKSALQGLVRGLARDLGPRGITVNLVQPGPIDTDLNPAGGPYAEFLLSNLAIKRFGRPGEIAALVRFLVGPEAAYCTGAVFTMDGGYLA